MHWLIEGINVYLYIYNPLIRVKRSKDGFLDNLKIKDNLDLDAEMVKPTTIYVLLFN